MLMLWSPDVNVQRCCFLIHEFEIIHTEKFATMKDIVHDFTGRISFIEMKKKMCKTLNWFKIYYLFMES